MKRILLLLALSFATSIFADTFDPRPYTLGSAPFTFGGVTGQVSVHTTGTQGTAGFFWSSTGAPAGYFLQDEHFDSPGVVWMRSGSAGGLTAPVDVPVVRVQCGVETQMSGAVFQIGGCLSLSGDNWITFYGDGSLSVPGGLLDNVVQAQGKLFIDLHRRAFKVENGITDILTLSNSTVNFHNFPGKGLSITGTTVSIGYTLSASDNGCCLNVDSASAVSITVPSGLPVGFNVAIWQVNTGTVTIVGSGTTIANRQGHFSIAGKDGVATLLQKKSDQNYYVLSGDTN